METPDTANGSPDKYIVQPGDCMASIAVEHGFLWETLWNLPENSELKQIRKDPYVLLPGDQVYIPQLRIKEQPCATDQTHKFVLKGVRERLRIVVTDDEDEPLADQPYVLVIDKSKRFAGHTDESGLIQQLIRPNARKGHLVVGEGDQRREYSLNLGHIDPIEETSGLQARLFNLGFYDGKIDGLFGSHTTTAVMLFQTTYNLQATGKSDDATLSKLKEVFGC